MVVNVGGSYNENMKNLMTLELDKKEINFTRLLSKNQYQLD